MASDDNSPLYYSGDIPVMPDNHYKPGEDYVVARSNDGGLVFGKREEHLVSRDEGLRDKLSAAGFFDGTRSINIPGVVSDEFKFTSAPEDGYERQTTSEPVFAPATNRDLIEYHASQILALLGYDSNNQHIARTPKRFTEVLLDYRRHEDPDVVKDILEVQFIEPGAVNSLLIEGPIRYISRCAHHLEPVDGKAWVAYIPNEAVCGLSKLARTVHFFARQLTVQEVVTKEIADAIETHLKPLGVMVVIEASHGCMQRRGVMEPSAYTTTSSVRGVFKESANARNEFLLLKKD